MDITEEATDEEEEETEEITTQVTTTINIVEFEKKMKNKKRIFTYFPFPKSHAEAQKYCENVGEKVASSLHENLFILLAQANLASIRDAKNNKLLGSFTAADFWVGGTTSDDGGWVWIDGSEWSYEHWNEGEPNTSGSSKKCVHYMRGIT